LSKNKVTFLNHSKITFRGKEDHSFIFRSATHAMTAKIRAKGVILATGRFPGGGLHADRERITETVLGLPVFQPVQRSQWFHLNFFELSGHAINRAGLETDKHFRPLDQDTKPAFENLYAIGSVLAHNDWIRLKSGSGVSCATAVAAVDHFHQTGIRGDHV